jgi:hypothetical protein
MAIANKVKDEGLKKRLSDFCAKVEKAYPYPRPKAKPQEEEEEAPYPKPKGKKELESEAEIEAAADNLADGEKGKWANFGKELRMLAGQVGGTDGEALKKLAEEMLGQDGAKQVEEEPEEAPKGKKELDPALLTKTEFAEAMAAIVGAIREDIKALNEGTRAAVEPLAVAVRELRRADEEKIARKAAETPAASLQDLVQSIIGPATLVDGRTARSKELRGPEQTEPNRAAGFTGVELLDVFMSGADLEGRQ